MASPIPWQDRVIPEPNSGCLLWEGATAKGYGQVRRGGKYIRVHRLVWEEARGPVPEGAHVLHRCDVKGCVNIEHLFLGTHADNMQDAWDKGAHRSNREGFRRNKTHCARGHLYSDENTGLTKAGHRYCRICHRLAVVRTQRARRARRNAELAVRF